MNAFPPMNAGRGTARPVKLRDPVAAGLQWAGRCLRPSPAGKKLAVPIHLALGRRVCSIRPVVAQVDSACRVEAQLAS
jgi:hypothetical protein